MDFYFRLIKPDWGKKEIGRGEKKTPNPDFVKEIKGPDVLGDAAYDDAYLKRKNQEGYNVYFFPNHPSNPPQDRFFSGRDVDVFNFVFVDMDLKDGVYPDKGSFLQKVLEEFPVKPSLVVDSGNGIHAYWKVSDLTRDSYMETQFRLIQHFNTDGSIWTPLQLMRMPGYQNTKNPNELKEAEVVFEEDREYDLREIVEHLPTISDDNARKMQDHIDRLNGVKKVEVQDSEDLDALPPKFVDFMEKNDFIRRLFEEPEKTKGDRSSADMSLANILAKEDFDRSEVMQVIANSKKGKTKGPGRFDYAYLTVDKAFKDNVTMYEGSVADFLDDEGSEKLLGDEIRGPSFFDCLANRWRKREVLGLVAGPGVGKTTTTLKIVKDLILNNPDNDDIHLFFSLEMPKGQIVKRWLKLIGERKDLSDRLHVITNTDDKGNPRYIGLQDVYKIAREIAGFRNRKIGSISIDHIGILNHTIDMRRKPDFGAEELDGKGSKKTMKAADMCKRMKNLAVMLDTFVIVQSQTTKDKAGDGDKPLNKSAAYGAAQFEWYMDYMMTIWQPLYKVHPETKLRVLGWQYCKIRESDEADPITSGEYKALHFDRGSGDLRPLTNEEESEFQDLLRRVREIERNMEKKEYVPTYTNSVVRNIKLVLLKHDKNRGD